MKVKHLSISVSSVFLLLSLSICVHGDVHNAYYSKASPISAETAKVILQNGTAGTSTIYTNNTSAKVSVAASKPPIFESGFETGDFSEWVNGTDYATGCSCTPVTSPKHHGSYAAEFYTDDSNEWAIARNVFDTIYDTLFARCYIQFTSMPASDGDIFRAIFILHEATAAPWYPLLAAAGLKNVGGTAKWYLQYQTGGSFYDLTADTPLPEADKWYCVEIKAIRDGTAGEARLWVDGVELLSATGLDNDEYTSNSNVEVGLGGDPINNATTIYVDCVKVADTYIGLEYDYVLRVNNTETDSWQIRLKKYSDSSISRLQNCTIYFHNSTDGTSSQIVIENGSYTNQTGPWYDLGNSETIYIAMTVEANSTGTSHVYAYLEILIPNTTTYYECVITFEIT